MGQGTTVPAGADQGRAREKAPKWPFGAIDPCVCATSPSLHTMLPYEEDGYVKSVKIWKLIKRTYQVKPHNALGVFLWGLQEAEN